MAKKRPPPSGTPPQYYASADYKRWVRAKMAGRFDNGRTITFEQLKARMKRHGVSVSTSAISQFLGHLDEEPVGSNTSLMPAMNKALGIAAPPLCDPADPLAQIKDRIAERWKQMTERDRRLLLELVRGDDEIDLTNDE